MKRLTDKKVTRIFELTEKGLSQRKIADKIGCSRSTVWYHLNKNWGY